LTERLFPRENVMTITEAATLYDTTPRTVHRWKEVGDEKGIPCPLSTPSEMPGWWEKCMERRCPVGVLAAAEKFSKPSPLPENHNAAPGGATADFSLESPASLDPIKSPEPGEIGFTQTIERLRKAEAAVGGAYQTAVSTGEVDKAARLRREWKELSEELRKAEMAALEMKKRSRLLGPADDYLPKQKVCESLDRLHAGIYRRFIRLLCAAYPEARRAMVSDESRRQWSEFAERFVKDTFGRLIASKFADEIEPAVTQE
jgi:hypothetical protein